MKETPSIVDLAYMAAFVDAEGCLQIVPVSGVAHVASITVVNTCMAPLQRLQRFFGGQIYSRKRQAKLGGGLRKQAWSWTVNNALASEAAAALLPYLTVKAVQAQALIEFNASRLATRTPVAERRFGRRDQSAWNRHEEFRRLVVEANDANIYKRVEMREPRKYIEGTTAEARREGMRRWRAANPDKVKATQARSHANRKEKRNAESKGWREKNANQVRANNQSYYEKHRDELNAKARARRAEKQAVEAGTATDEKPSDSTLLH